VKAIPGAHIWITEGKEIENYLLGSILAKVFDMKDVPDPGQFEAFFPAKGAAKKGTSFLETQLNRRSADKMEGSGGVGSWY